MDSIFGEIDTRLSLVPRWTVVPTIQKQNVAMHCFNVERIARRMAVHWLNILDPAVLDNLSQIALHHDDDEAVTGDMPSPAKSILAENYLDKVASAWYNEPGPLRELVKLADRMEAYWFLTVEVKLGNTFILGYREEVYKGMLDAARKAEGDLEDRLMDWIRQVDQIRGVTRVPIT